MNFASLTIPLLFLTPGAWVAFGLPLREIPFWARLFTGVALSPVVVCAQFFLLRGLGLPFTSTPLAIIMVNLPALYLIFKSLPQASSPSFSVPLTTLIACVALLIPVMASTGFRLYAPHTFLYSDPTYLFARGDLLLEDPYLAGVRLSYPVWPALVFQTVFSFLLDSPPASNWVWTNLVWLIVICGFAAAITRQLGGGKIAQAATVFWLTLGTNPIGYLLTIALPSLAARNLFGDLRYTPWVHKFYLYSTMPLGMVLIAALLYLLLVTRMPDRPMLFTMGLLLTGTGFLYPLVFPPACGIFCAKMLSLLFESRRKHAPRLFRSLLPFLSILAIALVVCFAEVRFLQQSHHGGSSVLLSTPPAFARKAVAALIATSLLLLGLAAVFRQSWKRAPQAMVLLLAGALACAFLHSALFVPYYDNEYKFMYELSLCLAAFPALATERLWRNLTPSRAAVPLLAIAILLVFPFLHRRTTPPSAGPVDSSSFYMRLLPDAPWSGMCQAVRTLTPSDAILVTQSSDVYFPAFTSRSLYVPAANERFPGVTLRADVLTSEIRGNGRVLLQDRRQVLKGLFDSPDPGERERSLRTLLSFNRPLAILIEPRHGDLLAWLQARVYGREIFTDRGVILWAIQPKAGGS